MTFDKQFARQYGLYGPTHYFKPGSIYFLHVDANGREHRFRIEPWGLFYVKVEVLQRGYEQTFTQDKQRSKPAPTADTGVTEPMPPPGDGWHVYGVKNFGHIWIRGAARWAESTDGIQS